MAVSAASLESNPSHPPALIPPKAKVESRLSFLRQEEGLCWKGFHWPEHGFSVVRMQYHAGPEFPYALRGESVPFRAPMEKHILPTPCDGEYSAAFSPNTTPGVCPQAEDLDTCVDEWQDTLACGITLLSLLFPPLFPFLPVPLWDS